MIKIIISSFIAGLIAGFIGGAVLVLVFYDSFGAILKFLGKT